MLHRNSSARGLSKGSDENITVNSIPLKAFPNYTFDYSQVNRVVTGFWKLLSESSNPMVQRISNAFRQHHAIQRNTSHHWSVPLTEFIYTVSFSSIGRSALFDFLRTSKLQHSDICVCPVRNKGVLPRGSSVIRELRHIPALLDNFTSEKAYLWIKSIAYSALDGNFPDEGNNCIKLLTYNVCGLPTPIGTMECKPKRFFRIGRELRTISADIIGLQEMWESSTELVLKASNYPHRFSELEVDRLRRNLLLGRSGLALMSKYPMTDCELLHFTHSSGLEWMVRKGAMYSRIQTPQGEVDVYNVHLASEPERLNKLFVSTNASNLIRENQLRELRDWIVRRSKPHIPVYVMGDFNFTEDNNLYKRAERYFGEDLFRLRYGYSQISDSEEIENEISGATFDPKNNKFARSPKGDSERLDYVWCKGRDNHHHLYGAERVLTANPLSDHFGVLVTIKEEN
jgi:endonuclease/exonuclease/phosphatase family metal-dependent hydrolase